MRCASACAAALASAVMRCASACAAARAALIMRSALACASAVICSARQAPCVCVCAAAAVFSLYICSLHMCSLCLQVIQPLVLSMSDRSSWRAINRVVLYHVLFVECVLYTCRTTSASATSTKVGRSAGRSAHVRCNSAHSASGHSPGRVSRSPPQTRSATASLEAIKP